MISVVIPSYNGAETLFQAIDSVLCQTTKTPLEILVIDDHSTDDTMEKMQLVLIPLIVTALQKAKVID